MYIVLGLVYHTVAARGQGAPGQMTWLKGVCPGCRPGFRPGCHFSFFSTIMSGGGEETERSASAGVLPVILCLIIMIILQK